MSRKIPTFLTIVFACVSLPALADLSDTMDGEADYTVTSVTDPSLDSFKTFAIFNYHVTMDNNGVHKMTYELPMDITGGKHLKLTFIEQNPGSDPGETVLLKGPNGRTECVGDDWDQMQCKVYFKNLGVTAQEASSYIEKKYAGTARVQPAKEVALKFLAEPIGDADTSGIDDDCDDCSIGNGEWRVQYQNPSGQWINAQMSLVRSDGNYFTQSGSGQLQKVEYNNGNQATGYWTYGSSSGWFRFTFQNNHNKFQGVWGTGNQIGQNQKGQWNGNRN